MKTFQHLSFGLLLLMASAATAQEDTHTFSNKEGKTLEDRIIKYDYQENVVTLENSGKVPLDTFSEADQHYILKWNEVAGFKSTMRFKTDVEKDTWAKLKHEQTVTPFILDVIQMPGKTTPNHNVLMLDNYEEYSALYLEAEGYSLTLRNQNLFPIENITVESKVFYEQEQFLIHDDMFSSRDDIYPDTVTTNKFRSASEVIPIIIPREEVVAHSSSALTVDHQVERNILVTTTEEDEGDEEGESTETIDAFGDFDDHGRRRRGRVLGAWFRIGIEGTDGEMVWREVASPSSIPDKFTWEGTPAED